MNQNIEQSEEWLIEWYEKYPHKETEKVAELLSHRKHILNESFKFTPETAQLFRSVIERVNLESRAFLTRVTDLYKKIYTQWQRGNTDGFSDFMIETSFYACPANLLSDTITIDHVLYESHSQNHVHNMVAICLEYSECKSLNEIDAYLQHQMGLHVDYNGIEADDWAEEWLFDKYSELKDMQVSYAAHTLLFHSDYAMADILRIENFDREVTVKYQQLD